MLRDTAGAASLHQLEQPEGLPVCSPGRKCILYQKPKFVKFHLFNFCTHKVAAGATPAQRRAA